MLQISSNNGEEVRTPPAPATMRNHHHKPRTSCDCCPYGYHIDLDFVRYCEVFNKTAAHSPASKLRERRRQRQSMEVLLGLTSPTVWQLEQQLPQVPQEEEDIPPPPPPIDNSNASAAIFRDALHKAVLDFEETLQRSNRKVSPPDLPDGFPETSPLPPESSLYYEHQPGVLRRSVSTSSLASSLSGESSVALAPARGAHPCSAAAAQDSDVASIGSAASGVSTCALQNIREQMAKSLEKMREMEEKLKLIPILQSQLVSLKEEKRLMLLQLKAGEAERNKLVSLENTDATDLKQRLENLSDRGLATPRMQRKFVPNDKDVNEETVRSWDDSAVRNRTASLKNNMGNVLNGGEVVTKVPMRDVGVDCSVLTRDVGVTHSSPKLRSVATQSKAVSPKSVLSFSAIRSETILPSPTSTSFHSDDLNRKHDKAKAEENLLLPNSTKKESTMKLPTTDNSTNTIRPDIKHAACGTDIRMNQLFTDQEVEKMIDAHGKKVSREEEALRARRRSDKAVLVKPRCTDTAVLATPRTRDAASSECTVNDVVCDKCNVRKRSVGVGSASFLRPPGDSTPASLLSITMTRSKSSDSFNLRPRLRPTSVKSTDTRDLHSFRDTAVNTMKRKLVDAGVGDRISTRDECVATTEPYNVVSECSKCTSSNNINSPSTPTSSPLSLFNQSTPSRIPRLAAKPTTSTSNHSNGKRPFTRQDTYTKISVDEIKTEDNSEQAEDTDFRVTPAESKAELVESKHRAESRLTAASASTDGDPSEEEDNVEAHDEEEEAELYSHCMPGGALFQVSQKKVRKKAEPSKEMRGAMKVLSDSLKKSPRSEVPPQLKNAVNIIQQEWFKISSTATANPLDVEDYLDVFEEISGQLLEHIVNMPDNSGNTAMHYAVSHGNFDVVSILLDSKVCNINQPNQAGYTSVMLVSLAQMRSETDSQVVQRLFQLADVNVRAKQHGQTALMLAASHGRLRMANMLLAAGADVNIQDEDGSTALMCAAEHGHVEMVRLILSQPDCDVSITDHDGSTALNIAMEAGHRDVGVLLYAHQHFSSRGSSPYSSLKPTRRPKS